MSENSLVFLPSRPPPAKKKPVVSSPVLGMLIFTATEIMFFAGLVSSVSISRSRMVDKANITWPPAAQPVLPVHETMINTAALLISAVFLYMAHRRFKEEPSQARTALMTAVILGSFFVLLQGREWVELIAQGLTYKGPPYGAFFFLIVGLHGLHALVGIGALVMAYFKLKKDELTGPAFAAIQIFWYFVVLMWPVLYWRVYF